MFPCFVAKTPQIIFLILYTRAIKTNRPQRIRTQWKPVFNSTRRGKCGKNIPMLSQSSYLLAAARKGRASLPMNFWGIELFRFATLLANLSRTSALSLPISALMCLASTLAGLEEEGEEYIGTWGEWGRGWGLMHGAVITCGSCSVSCPGYLLWSVRPILGHIQILQSYAEMGKPDPSPASTFTSKRKYWRNSLDVVGCKKIDRWRPFHPRQLLSDSE